MTDPATRRSVEMRGIPAFWRWHQLCAARTVGPLWGDMAEIPTPYEPVHLESPQTGIDAEARALELRLRQCGSLPAFWQSRARVDWLLHVLGESAPEEIRCEDVRLALRRFACWAAVEAGADAEDALLVYATALAGGRTPSRALRQQRDARQLWVATAAAEGMPRCIPVAAASLAAWYAGDEDVFAGARWVARFAIKAGVFFEAEARAPHWRDPDDDGAGWRVEWQTTAWLRAHPTVANRIREATDLRLARGLRAVIPTPFDATSRSRRADSLS